MGLFPAGCNCSKLSHLFSPLFFISRSLPRALLPMSRVLWSWMCALGSRGESRSLLFVPSMGYHKAADSRRPFFTHTALSHPCNWTTTDAQYRPAQSGATKFSIRSFYFSILFICASGELLFLHAWWHAADSFSPPTFLSPARKAEYRLNVALFA